MSSRYLDPKTKIMDKSKIKTPKTIKIKHPAPYSQSWSGPPCCGKPQTARKTSTLKSSVDKMARTRDTRPRLQYHGPDPTLPHLKYGVFPKKRSHAVKKDQSRVLGSSGTKDMSDKTPKATTEVSAPAESSAPLFVVRSLDTRFTKRLSRSASTHLDIKPRNTK